MKSFASIVLLAAAVVAIEYYDSKYDSINIDEIIHNDRILNNYAQCFLEKRPCTKDAAELRTLLADAVKTSCFRCSPHQIKMVRKIDDALIEHHPDLHVQILAKFDPTGQYRGPFRQYLEENS